MFFLACGACVSPGASECADHTLCSDGTSCVAVPDGTFQCATDAQLTACKKADEGTLCTVDGKPGTCFGGGCILAACGDGVVDADSTIEACDDRNQLAGDGCSADCKSTETCGNGVTDLALGEECDDGGTTLSGDGCTGHCKREYRLWRDVTPRPPQVRIGFGLATDPIRGVTIVGGGLSLVAVPNTLLFNETWRWDGATWVEAKPLVTPTPRADPAYAYDARRKRGVMFGGSGTSGNSGQATWEWDGVTWRERTMLAKPPARAGGAMACSPTQCVMFGGLKDGTPLQDTWLWDGTAWSAGPTAGPSLRSKAAMAYDPAAGIVLYGGVSPGGNPLGDVWVFASGTWTAKGSFPTPALGSSMAYDPVRQRIVLVDSTRTLLLDASGGTSVFSALGAPPASVLNMQIAWEPGGQRIIGVGQTASQTDLAMAALSAGGAWTIATESRPRSGANRTPAAYDPRRGTTIVVDAADGGYEWTGLGWIFRGGNVGRDGLSIVHDPSCAVTLAFGGGPATPASTKSNEVYRFPDAAGRPQWAQIFPTGNLPAPRTHHAMTYDQERKAFFVFGGYLGAPIAGDTWKLATTDCVTWAWSLVTPGTSPPPRYDAQLTYDPVRKVSVLFGGRNITNGEETPLGDTWHWDGTTWTERTPTTSPPERFNHGMTLDSRRRTIVLYGGRDENNNLDDTWEWDGTTWTLLAPALVPPGHNGMGLAPDVTGGLIAVNGTNGGNAFVAVLRLSSELSTERGDACRDASVDSDADGLKGCADPDCAGRCAGCGNGTCDPSEDYLMCLADCPAPPP